MRFFYHSAGLLSACCVLLTVTMHGQSTTGAIAPSSGKQLCSALTPEDFTKAGVPVSALHDANVDDSASAYCVYDSKAGKVELFDIDIFYPAGDTPEAAKGTERTVLAEVGGKFESIKLPGADSASIIWPFRASSRRPALPCVGKRQCSPPAFRLAPMPASS